MGSSGSTEEPSGDSQATKALKKGFKGARQVKSAEEMCEEDAPKGRLVNLNILHVQGVVPPPGRFFFGKIIVRGGQRVLPVLTWQETLTMDLLDDDVVVLGIFAAVDKDHFNRGVAQEYAAIYLPWDIIHEGMKGKEMTINLAMCPDSSRLGAQDPVTAYREAYRYSLTTFYQNPSVPHVRMQIVMIDPPSTAGNARSLPRQEGKPPMGGYAGTAQSLPPTSPGRLTPRNNGVNSKGPERIFSVSDADYQLLDGLAVQNKQLIDALKGTNFDLPDCSREIEKHIRALKKASRDNYISENQVAKLSQELEVVSNGLNTRQSLASSKDLPGGALSDEQRREKSAAILADLQRAQEENLQIINSYDSQTKALEAKLHTAKMELMEGRLHGQTQQKGLPPETLEQHLMRLQSLQVAYRDACSERDNLIMRYESRMNADKESGKKAIEKLSAENEALLQDAQDIRARMQAKVPPSSKSLSMQRDIGTLRQQLEEAERDLERDRVEREHVSRRIRDEAYQMQQELNQLTQEKHKVEEELDNLKRANTHVNLNGKERMDLTFQAESHTKELNRTRHMQQILNEKIKILQQECDQIRERAEYMARTAPQMNEAGPPSSSQVARLQNQVVELQQKAQALKRVDDELLKEREKAAQMFEFDESKVNVGKQMFDVLTQRYNEALLSRGRSPTNSPTS